MSISATLNFTPALPIKAGGSSAVVVTANSLSELKTLALADIAARQAITQTQIDAEIAATAALNA